MNAYDTLVLSRSPRLYWPMDNVPPGSMITSATDLSGNGLHGTSIDPIAAVAPLSRGALSSYGTLDNSFGIMRRLGISGQDLCLTAGGQTLECWFLFDATAATAQYPFIIGSGQDNGEGMLGVYYNQANRQLVLRCGHYTASRDFTAPAFAAHPVGRLFHLVATYDVGGGCRLFINGVKTIEQTAPWGGSISEETFQVGGSASGNPANRAGGSVSNVAVYGRALTDAEVYENFRAGSSEYDEATLDLTPYLYWRLDENPASTAFYRAFDCTPAGRHSASTYNTDGALPLIAGARAAANLKASSAMIGGATLPGAVPTSAGLTYACWVSFTALSESGSGPYPMLMSQGPENGNGGTYMFYNKIDRRFAWRVGDWSGNRDAYGPTMAAQPAPGSLFFLVGTMQSDGAISLYINAELGPIERAGPWSSYDSSGVEFRVGNNGSGTSFFFHGQVSHAAVFQRALSHAEIIELYEKGLRIVSGNAEIDGDPYTRITVYDAQSMALVDSTVPDSNGDYRFALRTAGSVYVVATRDGWQPDIHGPVSL